MFGARGIWLLLFVLLSAVVFGFVVKRMITAITEGTANTILRMVWPSGDSSPYAKTYSSEQALAARGDHPGALEAYDAAMRLHPTDPEPRFQAAELLFRSPTPERAAALFVEARRLSADNRARELYATQRLIDLYLGPLGDEPRAGGAEAAFGPLPRNAGVGSSDGVPGQIEAREARVQLAPLTRNSRGVQGRKREQAAVPGTELPTPPRYIAGTRIVML